MLFIPSSSYRFQLVYCRTPKGVHSIFTLRRPYRYQILERVIDFCQDSMCNFSSIMTLKSPSPSSSYSYILIFLLLYKQNHDNLQHYHIEQRSWTGTHDYFDKERVFDNAWCRAESTMNENVYQTPRVTWRRAKDENQLADRYGQPLVDEKS